MLLLRCCCYVALVVSDSVRPHRRQPTRLLRPWDSPGKNTGVGCHFLLHCRKVKIESEVTQLCPTLATPWTAAYQAPPSMGFSRQKYWSGVPMPSPISEVIDISPGNLDSSLCFFQPSVSHDVLCISRYADDTTLMAESEEELKSLLMKVKVESEKVGVKLNIQKTKIMASGPITSWEIDGETVETESDFIFLGSKITADGACSHDMKRHLILGRKAMTNLLNSVLKSRDITLPEKICLVKAMVFPIVMYGYESWTIKKVEH